MNRSVRYTVVIVFAVSAAAAPTFPAVEVVPLPERQVAFEIDGREVARYHGGEGAPKPFLFPLIGPAGKRLTALSHPVDPVGHAHHRSVWIGHQDVNGINFWEETEGNTIVMTALEAYGHEGDSAWFRAAHEWRAAAGAVVLREGRRWAVTKGEGGAYSVDLTMTFTPGDGGAVTFGKTPFGLLGVRVVPTMSVSLGGGRIRSSEGDVNEAEVHWKAAKWVDYSGPVAPGVVNGATVFDHPDNPGSPATFHVRDEGWMGASFTYHEPYVIAEGTSLTLRYRIYVHGPEVAAAELDGQWAAFAGE